MYCPKYVRYRTKSDATNNKEKHFVDVFPTYWKNGCYVFFSKFQKLLKHMCKLDPISKKYTKLKKKQ